MALIWLPNESDPAAQIKVVRAAALMNFLPLVIKAACLRGMINGPQRSCRPSASIPANAVARKLTKPSTGLGPGPGHACACVEAPVCTGQRGAGDEGQTWAWGQPGPALHAAEKGRYLRQDWDGDWHQDAGTHGGELRARWKGQGHHQQVPVGQPLPWRRSRAGKGLQWSTCGRGVLGGCPDVSFPPSTTSPSPVPSPQPVAWRSA